MLRNPTLNARKARQASGSIVLEMLLLECWLSERTHMLDEALVVPQKS
jgi:hypothetical protein